MPWLRSMAVVKTHLVRIMAMPEAKKMAHFHEWVVYSTALEDRCLMLQCVECGALGTVDDPTKEEWRKGYYAPSRPYRWTHEARVRLRHEPPCPFYVVRSEKDASLCPCEPKTAGTGERQYERFPREIV